MFRPRAAERSNTDGATPCAEKTIVEPSGASFSFSTKIAPRFLEIAHDVLVVDDLVPDVDRFVVVLESELDGLDGALDAGTKAARRRKEDSLDHGRDASRDPRGMRKARGSGGSAPRAFPKLLTAG